MDIRYPCRSCMNSREKKFERVGYLHVNVEIECIHGHTPKFFLEYGAGSNMEGQSTCIDYHHDEFAFW